MSSQISDSQEDNTGQLTRHAVHRYAYDSFLQPASSTNLNYQEDNDPSLVDDEDATVDVPHYTPKQTSGSDFKRPGFSTRF